MWCLYILPSCSYITNSTQIYKVGAAGGAVDAGSPKSACSAGGRRRIFCCFGCDTDKNVSANTFRRLTSRLLTHNLFKARFRVARFFKSNLLPTY